MAREANLMLRLGPVELLIILAIVVLIFGVGRIGKIGKELGTGMREFRKGVQGDEENKPADPPANPDQAPKS
jgi:sec-independent protein translocase protein TatA